MMSHSIFGWNLPPGCRVSDIPGNRPEDEAWEGYRYWIQLILGSEVSSHKPTGSNNLEEAKANARLTVEGRAFRYLLRRMR